MRKISVLGEFNKVINGITKFQYWIIKNQQFTTSHSLLQYILLNMTTNTPLELEISTKAATLL